MRLPSIPNSLAATIGLALLNPLSLSAQDAPNGEKLYALHCAQCHGVDLKGGAGSSFLDGIWGYGKPKNHISRNIKYGILTAGMPAWENVLNDAEIEATLDFILSKESNLGAPTPPPPTSATSQDYEIHIETLVDEMSDPWSIAFIDEYRALVTEVSGQLKWLVGDQLSDAIIEGTPAVNTHVQGGLLDVAIDPDYAKNRWVYLSYSDFDDNNNCMIGIVRGRINNNKWIDEERIFHAPADQYSSMNHHFGSRIAFANDGTLYFSIGDRGDQNNAQDTGRAAGKIHRINRDGSIPADNPFANEAGAIASVFSFGHRNPQGLVKRPTTGQIWATEHGPMGGDELNLIQPAKNYGWPLATYGINYDGKIISENTTLPYVQAPQLHWTPSIAVCGIDFHSGPLFSKWNDNLLATSLKFNELYRVQLEGDQVVSQEPLLKNAGRMRDVEVAPDGSIYILLNRPGRILKLTPAE